MTPEYVEMPFSPWESESKDAMVRQVNAVSLERNQIRYLLRAANGQIWSRSFGWINIFTVSSRAAGNRPASFDNLSVTGSVSLGFAIFPSIQLAQDKADAIRLQDNALILQNTQIVETTLGSLAEAEEQLHLASQAEARTVEVYQIKLRDYKFGVQPLTAVLLARNQLVDASIARVKAIMDINLQRVLIHRALLSDGFANIEGCRPAHHMPQEQRGPIDWIRRGGKAPKYPSFDDYCRGK
jgi:outer membrane protein TolC